MQILLSDEELELIKTIDTKKMGWGNDPKLKDNAKFQALMDYSEKEIVHG